MVGQGRSEGRGRKEMREVIYQQVLTYVFLAWNNWNRLSYNLGIGSNLVSHLFSFYFF